MPSAGKIRIGLLDQRASEWKADLSVFNLPRAQKRRSKQKGTRKKQNRMNEVIAPLTSAPMNPAEAVVLGIVQGLTEFLPISISAHLKVRSCHFALARSWCRI